MIRDAARTLTSRKFWQDLRAYYSSSAIAARLDRVAKRLRGVNDHP